jgi:hypothetical protein
VDFRACKYLYFYAILFNVKPTIFLIKERPWERYKHPVVAVGEEAHRPRKRFKVRLETEEDVRLARERGLPLLLIQSGDLKILHYPLAMPPTVVVPREYRDVIEAKFRIHTFQSLRALQRPRIEDIVVFLLTYDLIAARAVIERSRDLLDFNYLRKRIHQEDLRPRLRKSISRTSWTSPSPATSSPRKPS